MARTPASSACAVLLPGAAHRSRNVWPAPSSEQRHDGLRADILDPRSPRVHFSGSRERRARNSSGGFRVRNDAPSAPAATPGRTTPLRGWATPPGRDPPAAGWHSRIPRRNVCARASTARRHRSPRRAAGCAPDSGAGRFPCAARCVPRGRASAAVRHSARSENRAGRGTAAPRTRSPTPARRPATPCPPCGPAANPKPTRPLPRGAGCRKRGFGQWQACAYYNR